MLEEILEQGEQLAGAGDFAAARKCFETALTKAPSARAHSNLAVVNFAEGKLAEALQQIYQALQLEQDYAEAIQNLKTIRDQNPLHPLVLSTLGKVSQLAHNSEVLAKRLWTEFGFEPRARTKPQNTHFKTENYHFDILDFDLFLSLSPYESVLHQYASIKNPEFLKFAFKDYLASKLLELKPGDLVFDLRLREWPREAVLQKRHQSRLSVCSALNEISASPQSFHAGIIDDLTLLAPHSASALSNLLVHLGPQASILIFPEASTFQSVPDSTFLENLSKTASISLKLIQHPSIVAAVSPISEVLMLSSL